MFPFWRYRPARIVRMLLRETRTPAIRKVASVARDMRQYPAKYWRCEAHKPAYRAMLP